ncbi:hypothetical protein Q765_20865 [Flavobacterium rivuli WB 3.3-2 = DSM 21788]|uniref:Uncharacterized protein n=1 Tax=Flavobacterium rivuli WB 3.3-2 = DSM 21788 TaxID=1121895 RepID=A0A0A2M8F6_9FLAO|nr:hypothetical protein [Flavobacterium rivuli]KGO84570.1 hypothetical protein Q765_20865 [Flavobacterium rivuli WB 3.3-2 = DSM 21788]
MSSTHKNYNLQFVNKVFDKTIFKTVEYIIASNTAFKGLYFYLSQIEGPDHITDILDDVNKALQGIPFESNIRVGSETTTLALSNVQIEDQGQTINIPIIDFKSILTEYLNFLLEPPLEGTKV